MEPRRWPDFAAALCRLLSDTPLRRRIGAQARLTAETRFSWATIAESAFRSYQLLAPAACPAQMIAYKRLVWPCLLACSAGFRPIAC